jgi:hypothetical protein
MGFRLFVDDFGTGYSSLGYLTRMPVDVIKVDHGFTMRMLEDRRAAAIVKSTIELGWAPGSRRPGAARAWPGQTLSGAAGAACREYHPYRKGKIKALKAPG